MMDRPEVVAGDCADRSERPRVAVVHPRLGVGGSECCTLWMIEALKPNYAVSLITNGPVDLELLNQSHGTSLQPSDFDVVQVPMPWLLNRADNLAALRGKLLQRFCRRIAPNYDVLISAYNLADFGVEAIQRIADFSFDQELRWRLHPVRGVRAACYRPGPLRSLYLMACGFCQRWMRTRGSATSR